MRERKRLSRLFWLLAALIVMLFVFQIVSEYLSTGIRLGITIEQRDRAVEIVAVADESPAQRAGLQPDSILKSIDGASIQKISDITPVLKSADGASSLVVERDGKLHSLQITPGTSLDYRSLLLNLLLIIVYLSIALAAIRVSNIEPKIQLLGWFALVVAFDIATYFNVSYWPDVISTYSIFKNMLAALQFALVFHLLSLIPRPAPWIKRQLMRVLLYPVVLGVHLLFLLVYFELLSLGDGAYAIAGFVFENNASFLSWGIIVLSTLFFQLYHARTSTERRQVQWILAATIPWVLLQLSDILAPTAGWVYSDWYDLADKLAHMLFSMGILAAIFRYNLLDLSDLFPRNFFYALLTMLLLAIPAVVVMESSVLIARSYGPEAAIWGSGLLMLALGHAFSPIRNYLMQLIEGRVWYQQHHLGQHLRQLTEDISNMSDPELARRYLTSRLAGLIHSSKVILHLDTAILATNASLSNDLGGRPCWIGGEGKTLCLDVLGLDELNTPLHLGSSTNTLPAVSRLYEQGLELVFPLQLQHDNLGVLMIGRSLGGRRYSRRETELLNLFTQNIATWFAHSLLNSQIQFDELTGLYRREAILETLTQHTQAFKESGQPFSIAMIDLDDFKMINDQHGHLAGDEVLRQSSAAAKEQLHKTDKLGRYGGEEFLLIMPGLGIPEAVSVCENICTAMQKLKHRLPYATTASIGIANSLEIRSDHMSVAHIMGELVALADSRLYQAKANGKNRVAANY